MGRISLWVLIAVGVIVVAGLVYLMAVDVPAPVHHIEQVILNDRLGR